MSDDSGRPGAPVAFFDRVIAWSLDNRLLVVFGAALLLICGGVVATRLPVDVFPDLDRPTVTIMTEAHGFAPEEVESLVTNQIEMAMSGVPGVERVRSKSMVGFSIVWVEFDWGTDVFRNRQVVAERLQVLSLPEEAMPLLAPTASIMGEVVLIALSSETTPPLEVRALADWVVRRRIMTLPGVAQVAVIGSGRKEYQILLEPERLAVHGLSVTEAAAAAAAGNLDASGAFLVRGGREIMVRNLGRVTSETDVAEIVVAHRDGAPVRIGDLGAVRTGEVGLDLRRGDAGAMGRPAVILSVQKQTGVSTTRLTEEIEAAMEEIRLSLPADIEIRYIFRQADFIRLSISNVVAAVGEGSIFVVIVLFIFIANLRATFVTLTSIPLSLAATALVFRAFDLSINTMTLGGIAIAIGELADNAIVGVENVFRRLRDNRGRLEPAPTITVVYRATAEIRASVVFATVLVILVILPLFWLSGIEGRIFAPLGVAYVVSILSSLIVSLTVTPVLASLLLPRSTLMERGETRFIIFLKTRFRRVLLWTLMGRRPVLLMTVAALFVLAAAISTPFMGRSFLPELNEGALTVDFFAEPGTSLAESSRLAATAERVMLTIPEVVSVGRRTGRAELDEHAKGVHFSEINVELSDTGRPRPIVLAELRTRLAGIPGARAILGQPISHRIDHMMTGVRTALAVKVFGPDLGVLRRVGAEVEAALGGIPGVVDIALEEQVLVPQLRIRVRRADAARYGVRVGDLVHALEIALGGKRVSTVIENERQFDLSVRLADRARGNVDAIRTLLLPTPSGALVPLEALADIHETLGPNQILHENGLRRIVVGANIAGRDLGSTVDEARARVAERVRLPEGYYVTYGGQFEAQEAAATALALLSLGSLAAIFFVLYAHFRSVTVVLQILLSIPFATIGSVSVIWFTDQTLSIAGLIGFIALTGIASHNTIMMLSHYIHLVLEEGETWSRRMIVRGTLERLTPVLMTAATTALALLPCLLAADEPGKEILHPLAVVILGGLVSATILNLFVTPAVFWLFGRRAIDSIAPRRARAAAKS